MRVGLGRRQRISKELRLFSASDVHSDTEMSQQPLRSALPLWMCNYLVQALSSRLGKPHNFEFGKVASEGTNPYRKIRAIPKNDVVTRDGPISLSKPAVWQFAAYDSWFQTGISYTAQDP